MALEDRKQEISQGKIVEKPGQKTVSPQKEEKKDTSILEGKPDMASGDFMYKLRNQNLYSKTNLTEERRAEIGKRVFGSYGSRIEKGEIEKAKRKLNLGKMDLLAKAERKTASKLKGALENFYLSEIEFIQGKAYKTLTDAILIDDFKNLRKDLQKLQIAHKISELFDNLIKGEEPDPQIWQLLTETFNTLNTHNLKPKIYSLIY